MESDYQEYRNILVCGAALSETRSRQTPAFFDGATKSDISFNFATDWINGKFCSHRFRDGE